MNWNQLWIDFIKGKPDAIQAIFAFLGFPITTIGIIYVAITFRQQKKINKEQQELNRFAMEKDRREVFAYFVTIKREVEGQLENEVYCDLFLKDNKVLNVEYFSIYDIDNYSAPFYLPASLIIPDMLNPFSTLKLIRKAKISGNVVFQYLIYFTDQIGRPYYQKIGVDGDLVVCIYPQQVDNLFRQNMNIIA